MKPRELDEKHRSATPLELLFDLVSVIAIAAAAMGLHHSLAEAHFAEGIIKFAVVFFSIWWAWMNFTWFASAYDNDDAYFRILTMIVMSGALVMASGINIFFKDTDLTLMVIGFIIMRLGMVVFWLRAAWFDKTHRKAALRYAGGISLAQIFWSTILLLQPLDNINLYTLIAIGALIELLVPVIAERHTSTTWHRHHIIERYGLLNIIVLGETLLAGSMAINRAMSKHFDITLIYVAASALVTLFSLWWLYFSREEHLKDQNLSTAFSWAYGHFFIYMAGAAVGAGFAVLIDILTQHSDTSLQIGVYSIAIPVSIYIFALWFVRDRLMVSGLALLVLPLFAILTLVVPQFLAFEGVALMTALCVITRSLLLNLNKN